MLCGSRVGVWKQVKDRNYMLAYLRGHFGGASDPLEINTDGKSLRGLANGNQTRHITRVEFDATNNAGSLVGKWDFNNGNITTFTPEGWMELCGLTIGIWTKEGERRYLASYLRGYFGGASDPLVLSDDGQTIRGLIDGNWETSTVSRVIGA